MFELSGKIELLYCINCEHNEMIYTSTDGKQFHYYYQSFNRKAKPIECHGPFAYSEPISSEDFELVAWFNIDDEIARDFNIPLYRGEFEKTDVEQLSSITAEDKYYPSLVEILIDNVYHGDVSLYEQ